MNVRRRLGSEGRYTAEGHEQRRGAGVGSPHHDDGHAGRGVAVLGCGVEVRLQFTCDLHLHVVPQGLILHARKKNKQNNPIWDLFRWE